ncbi:OadG family protein [Desulfogranum mediterraneum]|uniref:OadG family protein n=1 Tax=Desulfogranum mediterraneum TaxID=160661 RepID=UPI00041FF1A4|nr:OadG family protein [Desulfogranum mediterraneum]
MAIVGATIVLSGLTILSLIISQLHKIVGLLEKKATVSVEVPQEAEGNPKPSVAADNCPSNIAVTIEIYQPLVEELEEQFQLADLYELAEKYHLPHPHLSIRCLREAGKLESLGDGYFRLAA